jgi:hypothetical protein
LQQRGKKLKNIEPEVIPIPQDVEAKADVAADDYLEQLQQRGKKAQEYRIGSDTDTPRR